jgi:crossover junction endodeoxyribonuclease RusA
VTAVELPLPHKILWPNGRTLNRNYKAAETKKHRAWAFAATKATVPPCFKHNGARISIRLTVYPKGSGAKPDKDNCQAACKAYFDGIADALGVNDKLFDYLPTLVSDQRTSRVTVLIGEAV